MSEVRSASSVKRVHWYGSRRFRGCRLVDVSPQSRRPVRNVLVTNSPTAVTCERCKRMER